MDEIPRLRWTAAPRAPGMPVNAVHVWLAATDVAADCLVRLSAVLSAEERAKADRFHFERDRIRFVATRGQLRTILGRYAGQHPGEIEFRYGPYGKPSLAGRPSHHGLQFNLSHSGRLAVYAVTCSRRVGIDIEFIDSAFGWESIAERFFSSGEREQLEGLPAPSRRRLFYTLWTFKEAYIKARGEGLAIPPDSFEVSLQAGGTVRLISGEEDHAHSGRWNLVGMRPDDEYAAALAYDGVQSPVEYWLFTGEPQEAS